MNKITKYIPNITTLANMSVGLLSISMLVNGKFNMFRTLVSTLILLSAALDCLDGKLARALNSTSLLGKQLDSFADIISFGVTPAMIMLSFVDTYHPIRFLIVYIFTLFYVICGVIRLARFNINDYEKYFVGLPITIGGVILSLYFIIAENTNYYQASSFTVMTLSLTFVLSILMVLNFKVDRNFIFKLYSHLKSKRL